VHFRICLQRNGLTGIKKWGESTQWVAVEESNRNDVEESDGRIERGAHVGEREGPTKTFHAQPQGRVGKREE